MIKKILKVTGIVFIILLISLSAFVYFTVPKLTNETEAVIESVLKSKIPDFIKGDSSHIFNGNTKVWYESIKPKDSIKGTVVLFMGISNDALGWPQAFLDKLVKSGFHIIRFDYRGTGLSDWCEDNETQLYSLKDIAEDAKIITDSLKIEKVNLLGVSMGGMVAQEFAINYPKNTKSLTCIMSSGNIIDEKLPEISFKIIIDFIKLNLRYGIFQSEKNTVKLHVSSRMILRGNADYEIDVKETAEQVLFNLRNRRGFNPKVSKQHNEAVYRSGSRYEKLKELKIPMLFIHGLNDPFVPIEHSKKLADLILDSETKWVENMGHDIPACLIDTICNKLISFTGKND